MIRPKVGGAVLCLVVLASTAWADGEVVVTTTDGETHRGRLLKDEDRGMTVEVQRGSLTAEVFVRRAKIAKLEREGEDPRVSRHERQAQEARAVADPDQRAEALQRVAGQLERDGGYRLAGQLYEEAGQARPGLRDQTDVSAARAYRQGGDLLAAQRAVARALERNPKHSQARALGRDLAASFQAKATQLIEPGLEEYMADRPAKALKLFVDAVESLPRPVLDEASRRLEQEAGLGLAELMVDCRLRSVCSSCQGAGAADCPAADDNVSTRCRFGRRVTKLRTRRIGKYRVATWQNCHKCDGMGFLPCGSAEEVRTAYRGVYAPEVRFDDLGFRCVRSLPAPAGAWGGGEQ